MFLRQYIATALQGQISDPFRVEESEEDIWKGLKEGPLDNLSDMDHGDEGKLETFCGTSAWSKSVCLWGASTDSTQGLY
jgi:hypothetical protein